MKHCILYRLPLLLLFFLGLNSCNLRQHPSEFPSYIFTVDTLYPTTSIKHQGKSSNCWAYATASLFETEWIIQHNDTIHLSAEYIVRCKYQMQFDYYYNTDGKKPISKGGLGHTFLHVFHTYGILPWQEYNQLNRQSPDYRRLLKQIRRMADKAVNAPQKRDSYRTELYELLNTRMGIVPDSFSFCDRIYTPQSFAQLLPSASNEYIELTSFSNYPYQAYCQLNLPDNWEHLPFYNVSLDDLIHTMTFALQQGYTFVWDGDVSEPGFSAKKGIAIYPQEAEINEQTRLNAFLSGETTDDHMMHIVGLAHNQAGERFFIAKNSYGNIGPYGGYIYLSERYVKMKTITVFVDKRVIKSS